MTRTPRRRLAVALLFSVTVAGLLWVALKAEPGAPSPSRQVAPRLFDEPFRGAAQPAH